MRIGYSNGQPQNVGYIQGSWGPNPGMQQVPTTYVSSYGAITSIPGQENSASRSPDFYTQSMPQAYDRTIAYRPISGGFYPGTQFAGQQQVYQASYVYQPVQIIGSAGGDYRNMTSSTGGLAARPIYQQGYLQEVIGESVAPIQISSQRNDTAVDLYAGQEEALFEGLGNLGDINNINPSDLFIEVKQPIDETTDKAKPDEKETLQIPTNSNKSTGAELGQSPISYGAGMTNVNFPSSPNMSGRPLGSPNMVRSKRLDSPRKQSLINEQFKHVDLKKFKRDDFVFGAKIGKGKYGDVFMAQEKKTNWIVALKVLDKMKVRQLRAQRQIVREIKYHSYLKHENIIKLYGVFHDDDKIYMILEYASNGEVYKELKNSPNKRFTEEKAAKYLKQILQAIIYLHSQDIIHRDLKPENLLNSYGTIKLADFGWSVYAPETGDKRKTFCGTLDYLPPEMLQGKRYDYHSDNWSIGIMAFEFVTGAPPFGQRTQKETLDCILKSELELPAYISDECKAFIQGLLNPNPKQRMELPEAIEHPWIVKYNL